MSECVCASGLSVFGVPVRFVPRFSVPGVFDDAESEAVVGTNLNSQLIRGEHLGLQ